MTDNRLQSLHSHFSRKSKDVGESLGDLHLRGRQRHEHMFLSNLNIRLKLPSYGKIGKITVGICPKGIPQIHNHSCGLFPNPETSQHPFRVENLGILGKGFDRLRDLR